MASPQLLSNLVFGTDTGPPSGTADEEVAAHMERPLPGCGLLRHPLNGHCAEFRVFVTDLASLLVIGSIAPSFRLFEAIPLLNSNAGRWWCSLK